MVDKEIFNLIEGKYRKKYAEKYGIESLMNIFDTSHWKDSEGERIYKHCLENNVTWEEYLNRKKDVIT